MIKNIFIFIFSLLLWVIFWLSATVTISIFIIVSFFVPKRYYNPLVTLQCKILMYSVFLFPEHKGIDKGYVPYPAIYVANHVSFLDLFISGSVLPGNPRGVELKAHFSKPIYGWFITRFGEIPIDPTNRTSIKNSFQEAENILKNRTRSILFMPEGHRTKTGNIEKFRYGAFYLSRSSGIPIVPIVYKGLFERNNSTNILIKPGKFDVIMLDPVYPENFESDEIMSNHVRDLMIKKLEEKF
jgi:1-acyl-sn-glycerol-3-phosphate acyltransferase